MHDIDTRGWYAIARSQEAPVRHVYQAQLFGYEFAVWRDDNGAINVWENRCPHRGLRLSLGVNTGTELRCQYHGWTYESQTGACTHIPAHPSLSEPSKACARTIAAVEREGYIWIALDPLSPEPDFAIGHPGEHTSLRSLPINRPADAVRAALDDYRYNADARDDAQPDSSATHQVTSHIVELNAGRNGAAPTATATLTFLLQPASADKTILHATIICANRDAAQIRRYHAGLMNRLRIGLEADSCAAAHRDAPPTVPIHTLLPVRRPPKREFNCRIRRRRAESEGVISLELTAADTNEPLPTLAPGAHLNVTTPCGLVRQYSVVNGPSERDSITIGVKLEPNSRGGSKSMHEAALDGTVLQASVPRNTFALASSGKLPLLIAGGIGITPLISMAHALHDRGEPFELHYFVRAGQYVSFKTRLAALGQAVRLHTGLNPAQTAKTLSDILHGRAIEQSEVYACGPGPMLAAVSASALGAGIAADDIHFEYFKNDAQPEPGVAFTVRLARSGRQFKVPGGTTLLHALHEQGIELDASCEQGVCGTCFTAVVAAGDIEHNDLYLSGAEKSSGKCIMPCVSRARSGTLVLDL